MCKGALIKSYLRKCKRRIKTKANSENRQKHLIVFKVYHHSGFNHGSCKNSMLCIYLPCNVQTHKHSTDSGQGRLFFEESCNELAFRK